MRKRSLILAVMLIGSLFSNSVFAADEENWDWVSGDRSEKLGTLGEYVVKGNCDSDVPWAFWCGCTVETEGNAKLTFKSRGTAYYKKLTSHTVSVGATAVTGSVHVTSSGVEVLQVDLIVLKHTNAVPRIGILKHALTGEDLHLLRKRLIFSII